jgi:valine--pyruvate aminotransferase
VLTIAELEQLDAAARQRGVPLVIDAAYGLPFPGLQFEDGAAFWNDNVILCLSLSKLGLPGARTGIVVAHESVIEAITAFNATAALAPAGTAATIVEPLLRNGELLRLCREVVRPHYVARCRQAIDWLRAACTDLPLLSIAPKARSSCGCGFPGCRCRAPSCTAA